MNIPHSHQIIIPGTTESSKPTNQASKSTTNDALLIYMCVYTIFSKLKP